MVRFEVVRVGWESLVGEIIKIEQDTASIQVPMHSCDLHFCFG